MLLPENIICGHCDCSEFGDLKISPRRTVRLFEIEFYLEDAFDTTADDNVYRIKKDYIQIAKPGQVRHTVLPFRTVYLKFSASGELADLLSAAPEYFRNCHPQQTYSLMNEIILFHENGSTLLLHSRILSLLYLVLADSKIPTAQNGDSYAVVSAAKDFIEAHFREPIRLKDIASSVHLSEIYFHNIFTAAVGVSPHRYLINCRIENAKQHLWNSEKSISEIAEDTGFGCQQYFNKVFKKETGMTPAAYRKSFQQKYLL